MSRPSEQGGEERVFTGPDGEVRVRPTNAIVANNTEMLRQFALLGMGVAILPSYLIGRDLASGRLVPLLADYRLPQIEITIAYPSRLHLPAKVRTFIDHLVEHFQQQGQPTRDPRTVTPARSVPEAAEVMMEMGEAPEQVLSADAAHPLHKGVRSRMAASSPF